MSKDIVLGIGDYILTSDRDVTVRVYALGSCIALILYEPIQRYLAMVHIMAPRAAKGMTINQENRGLYVDTALPWLFEEFHRKTNGGSICRVGIVGGSNGISDLELLAIGKKNFAAVTVYLTERGIHPSFQDVGGRYVRSVETEVSTGKVRVQRRPFQRIGCLKVAGSSGVKDFDEVFYKL